MTAQPTPKILSVDEVAKTMIIDWGNQILNHEIPLYILENPGLTKEEIVVVIESLRPPAPVEYEVPQSLKDMVEPEGSAEVVTEEVSL